MNYIRLGKSSLNVSNIGLGGINFGTKTTEEKAFELMDCYFGLGGNFIDTANNYAVWNGGDGGESERVIGNWLSCRGQRDNVVIATKLGALPKQKGGKGFSDMQGLKRDVILYSVENSLKNLKTDTIDLLYLHVDDFETPQQEVLETLSRLVYEGTVKEIGCSNFYTWRIERARRIAEEYQFPFFCAIQQRYSYLSPVSDARLFPQIAVNQDLEAYLSYYRDMTLVAYSPLLKGQYNVDSIARTEYQTAENQERLYKLRKEQLNPNKWVMNYITESLGGSAALITTSSVEHLNEVMY